MKMPKSPKEPASNINGKRSIRKAMDMLKEGSTKLDMAVVATTITMAAEMIPASTAACPMTSVPTIEIAEPIFLGKTYTCLSQDLEGQLHQ